MRPRFQQAGPDTQRRGKAQKGYLAAIRTLATFRRLLATADVRTGSRKDRAERTCTAIRQRAAAGIGQSLDAVSGSWFVIPLDGRVLGIAMHVLGSVDKALLRCMSLPLAITFRKSEPSLGRSGV
jgi:hypothetical protein